MFVISSIVKIFLFVGGVTFQASSLHALPFCLKSFHCSSPRVSSGSFVLIILVLSSEGSARALPMMISSVRLPEV